MSPEGMTERSVLDLMKLCDENPQEANSLVTKGGCRLLRYDVTGVPSAVYNTRPLSCASVDRLVSVRGSVIRVYEVLFKNVVCEQTCLSCNASDFVCEDSKKRMGVCSFCGSTGLRTSRDFAGAIRSQSIRIQDIGGGAAMSETIEVVLEGEGAGRYVPGDKLYVAGVISRRWRMLKPGEPMVSSLLLRSVLVEKEEEDESRDIRLLIDEFRAKSSHEKRRFLLESLAPSIVGLAPARLAILLTLMSTGKPNAEKETRKNIHVLFVGDPGTGKSHLLKQAAKLVCPAIATNGVGTSDAGLTSCAIRHGKEWSIEGGALALADTGLCCIDEFHKLRVNEKSGLLEAMEQQTISIAKAGIVTTINTRCSIIAAASSRNKLNQRKPIAETLGLSTPLISRFDLIIALVDSHTANNDAALADSVLNRMSRRKAHESVEWPLAVLRSFIVQNRRRHNVIPEHLARILLAFYTAKRRTDGPSEFNTVRMLESLVRLAESHSKLMSNGSVTEEDIYVAMILTELTIGATSPITINPNTVFTDPAAFEQAVSAISSFYSLDLSVPA